MRIAITLCILLTTPSLLLSQERSVSNQFKGDIHLISKHYGDSIALRWGYDEPDLWFHHLSRPVSIYRKDLSDPENAYVLIDEVKPWTEEKIETFASSASNPDMLVVVLQNIHRNWENTYKDGDASLMEKIDNFKNRWSLVHYASDMDKTAAQMAGLMYIDRDIDSEVTYSYKVAATPGNFFPRESYQITNRNRSTPQPLLYDALGKENEVHLLWERAYHEEKFSGYFIEKSMDGKSFSRINEVPYVQMFSSELNEADFFIFKDSVHTDKIHYYRLIGIDAFGDASQPSITLSARSKDLTPPPAPQLSIDTKGEHLTAGLSWIQPEADEVSTYHLERTFGDASYTFENWASGGTESQDDKTILEGLYGYRLIAEDTLGNQSFSNQVFTMVHDTEPPNPPTGLIGSRDTSGNIVLTWDKAKEQDVIGYYIYASDGKKRNLTRISDVPYRSRLYIDSLSRDLQNEKRFYQIAAVDNDYMVSGFTEILVVDRPDSTPPSPGLINHYEVRNDGIQLHFLPSSSRDVKTHQLRRKKKGETTWVTLWNKTGSILSYLDEDVDPATSYTYAYQAIDDQNNISKVVKELTITSQQTDVPTPRLVGGIQEKHIALSWNGENNIQKAILYRSIGEGKPTMLKRLSHEEIQYIDTTTIQGKQYTYYLKFVDRKGRGSRFSEPVTITL